MTDYTALATAIKTTLLADAWIGDPANVKIVETGKRGFSVQDEKDTLYFGDGDLPALAIIANASPQEQSVNTTNEIRSLVAPEIMVVSKHRDAQAGIVAQDTIVANVERVLEKQKSSSADLGIDAFVEQVSSSTVQEKKGEYYYFVSTIVARVELTTAF